MAYKELLKNIYLFKDLTHTELDPIQNLCKTETLNKGDVLFEQGSEANCIFVVKYGTVKIVQRGRTGESIEVSVLGTGSHFGEMPFLDGGDRSANAIVDEKSEIIQIPYAGVKKYLDQNSVVASKLYKALATFLCGRLRTTTLDYSFAREKNISHF